MGIQFKQVGYGYRGFKKVYKALNKIDLTIAKEGEFVAITGQTGSGKSTLVQHMNALLKPTEGEVNILGTILPTKKKTKVNHLRQKVGLVFQFPEYQLFEISILKDVEFGPSNFKDTKPYANQYAVEALKTVGIDESLYQESPFRISGGQMRRVAIAGILAMKPNILVLDEPTRGLDPQGKDDIMDLFKEIHDKENKSIVLITHDMDIVAKYAKRVIVLDKGEIVFDGKKEELFSQDVEKFHLDYPTSMKVMKHLSKELGIKEKLVLDKKDLLNHLKEAAK
ncbi:energy-coupling factor transporter ATPase [Acholeplasma equirhinis]|uniref:energy-coupling factor transporter ATPase n=1 Tax=Acholeplasma equirhinis TaxID=555393 RepID=UPI00197AAFD6|nr:energy-coupling factor transporter ATPase [Acholeplasma equirhinis]MBN3490918.1 energy-coupling factor transporter ATPase [Acholeplasma equirhinis]